MARTPKTQTRKQVLRQQAEERDQSSISQAIVTQGLGNKMLERMSHHSKGNRKGRTNG